MKLSNLLSFFELLFERLSHLPLSAILTNKLKPSAERNCSFLAISSQKSLARVLDSTSNASFVSSGKQTLWKMRTVFSYEKNSCYSTILNKNLDFLHIYVLYHLYVLFLIGKFKYHYFSKLSLWRGKPNFKGRNKPVQLLL